MVTAGDLVGAYRLVRELGRGGMGAVWVAEHTTLRSLAAIKFVHGSTDEDSRARFVHEGKAMARIRHPGIVAVSDFGLRDDGVAYLVMELLDGESLQRRLAAGPLAWSEAVELGRQIADALAAAHRAGVVHRDLKPGNIHLVPDAAVRGGWRAKLLDFGIAKASRTDELAVTRTGALLGTPLYMAPEQCTTTRGPVVAATDLYALGAVLFEMVVGRPPFVGTTLGDLLEQHLHAVPASVRALVPTVPAGLDQLVARLLSKAPADRGGDAAAVARCLAELARPEVDAVEALAATAAPLPQASAERSLGPVATKDAVAAVALAPTVVPPPVAARRRRGPLWVVAGVAAAAAVTVAAGYLGLRGRARARPELRALDQAAVERRCRDREAAACTEAGRRSLAIDPPDHPAAFARFLTACDLDDLDGCVALADRYRTGTGVKIDDAKAIELYARACAGDRGTACAELADHQRTGRSTPRDLGAARTTAAHACALGAVAGCTLLGQLEEYGFDRPADHAAATRAYGRAEELATRGCDAGEGQACWARGAMQVLGLATTADPARGFVLMSRACELGHDRACADVGEALISGDGVRADPERGGALLRRACRRGEAVSCQALATHLSFGHGLPRDEAEGRRLSEAECNQRGDSECAGLALLYVQGRGVPKDLEQARRLFQRACDAGGALGCTTAAELWPDDGPDAPARRRELAERACHLGNAFACVNAGMKAFQAKDQVAGKDWFAQACALSAGRTGCVRLGEVYLNGYAGVDKDPARAIGLFERACAADDRAGCHLYAMRMKRGDGIVADLRHALELLLASCRGGWAPSCVAAADILTEDAGVPPDPPQAAELRQRACDADSRLCPADAGVDAR